MYMRVHTHTHLHVVTIKDKEAMNTKESSGWGVYIGRAGEKGREK